jgi:hypothetical protein
MSTRAAASVDLPAPPFPEMASFIGQVKRQKSKGKSQNKIKNVKGKSQNQIQNAEVKMQNDILWFTNFHFSF